MEILNAKQIHQEFSDSCKKMLQNPNNPFAEVKKAVKQLRGGTD